MEPVAVGVGTEKRITQGLFGRFIVKEYSILWIRNRHCVRTIGTSSKHSICYMQLEELAVYITRSVMKKIVFHIYFI